MINGAIGFSHFLFFMIFIRTRKNFLILYIFFIIIHNLFIKSNNFVIKMLRFEIILLTHLSTLFWN